MDPDPAAITEALAPLDRLVAGLTPSITHAKEISPTTLEFTKACEPNPVNPGELITYTLYITNTDSVTASIFITDPLPANVTFEAYNQRYDLECRVWTLAERNPLHQATQLVSRRS